ncbi:hypothetical protein ABVN80_11460 [Acinetobacter baumannii]
MITEQIRILLRSKYKISISGVIRRLPDEVQRQGVTVGKSLGDTFMVIGLYDSTGRQETLSYRTI